MGSHMKIEDVLIYYNFSNCLDTNTLYIFQKDIILIHKYERKRTPYGFIMFAICLPANWHYKLPFRLIMACIQSGHDVSTS